MLTYKSQQITKLWRNLQESQSAALVLSLEGKGEDEYLEKKDMKKRKTQTNWINNIRNWEGHKKQRIIHRWTL